MGYKEPYMIFVPLLVIILLLYVVFRNPGLSRDHTQNSTERSPLDILNKRYAEGSLSQDEYLHMKEELSKKN